MDEPPNDGIVGAAGSAWDRPTFSRVLFVLAATVVVLVGMRLAAPVLDTFPETRWLANFMGIGTPDAETGPSG